MARMIAGFLPTLLLSMSCCIVSADDRTGIPPDSLAPGCFDDPEFYSYMGMGGCSTYEPGQKNDIFCEFDGVFDNCCAACNADGDRGVGNGVYPIAETYLPGGSYMQPLPGEPYLPGGSFMQPPPGGPYLPGGSFMQPPPGGPYLPGGSFMQPPPGVQTGPYFPGGPFLQDPAEALFFENCPSFAAFVSGSDYSYTTSPPSMAESMGSMCKEFKDEKTCADNPMAQQLASQLCADWSPTFEVCDNLRSYVEKEKCFDTTKENEKHLFECDEPTGDEMKAICEDFESSACANDPLFSSTFYFPCQDPYNPVNPGNPGYTIDPNNPGNPGFVETSICDGLKKKKCKKLDGCKYSSKTCIPDTCDGLNKKKCNKKGWCEYNNNECLAVEARCDTHSCSAGTKKSDPASLVGDDDYTCCDGCFDDPEFFSPMGYCSSYEPGQYNDMWCEFDGVLDICCAACNADGDRGVGSGVYPIGPVQTGHYLTDPYPITAYPSYPGGPQIAILPAGAYPGSYPGEDSFMTMWETTAKVCTAWSAVKNDPYDAPTSDELVNMCAEFEKKGSPCGADPLAVNILGFACASLGADYTGIPGGGAYTTSDGGAFTPGYNVVGDVYTPGYNAGADQYNMAYNDPYGAGQYGTTYDNPYGGPQTGPYNGPYFSGQDSAAYTQIYEGGYNPVTYYNPNGR